MQRIAAISQTSARRRATTLAGSLAFVLIGAALYAHSVSAATLHPSHSHGISTLAAAAQSQAATTAWTSLRVDAFAASINWDAARRECVAVPGAAATAARFSSFVS
ncbi:MAG TPA: hypothetical protein VM240_06180 [Verrucomicrobiae bacterium]|nr:hypothetical protein [Verrucomicrobiae bacterium]